jgi:RpiR family carbohydrate utilization transcriptional regulator
MKQVMQCCLAPYSCADSLRETCLDNGKALGQCFAKMPRSTSVKKDRVPRVSLAELIGRLTRKRQEVIRPVLENPREFVLLSVRSMADRLKSDPATTVRIVRRMGFPSYRDFQRFLHDLSIAHATSFDLMRSSSTRDGNIPSYARKSLEQDSNNLQGLRNSLEYKRIEKLVRRVYEANRIVLIGGDLASSLVTYFEYHLTLLGFTVLTATTPGYTAHLTRMVGRRDLVFAVSFRRGLRQTVEGIQQAKARGAYCVGITDTFVSPVARFSDESFLASVETTSFGVSYVAPMALLDVILVACANYRRSRTLSLLREADKEQRLGFRWYET